MRNLLRQCRLRFVFHAPYEGVLYNPQSHKGIRSPINGLSTQGCLVLFHSYRELDVILSIYVFGYPVYILRLAPEEPVNTE